MINSMTANLMVESVDRAVAFYVEQLGFSVVTTVPGPNSEAQFAIVVLDNCSLMFQDRKNMGLEYPTLATEQVHPSISLYIQVDDLEHLYPSLKGKVPLCAEMHTSFYGAREFAVTDPDGYVLTFAEQTAK